MQIFHSVCLIAEILLSLQKNGHIKYIGWAKQFTCGTDGVLKTLQLQANEMEKDLEVLKKKLSYYRNQFYELNYFSNLQLLSLRLELSQCKYGPVANKAAVKKEVMSLLHSLSREITPDSVKEYVQELSSLVVEQQFSFGSHYGMY